MKLSFLLATGLTALTMASPGVALAWSNTNANNNRPATHNSADNATTATYSHIGQGGMNGSAMPIANNNGDSNAAGISNNRTASNDNNNANANRPSQRNPLLADNGDVRIGKMVGATVYNRQDQKLGSVDGVLAGRNGLWAIVSTNDQSKTVAVPFKDFVFGNYQANGDDEVVLPNQTLAGLDKLPVFHYDATQYANGNNNGRNNNG